MGYTVFSAEPTQRAVPPPSTPAITMETSFNVGKKILQETDARSEYVWMCLFDRNMELHQYMECCANCESYFVFRNEYIMNQSCEIHKWSL